MILTEQQKNIRLPKRQRAEKKSVLLETPHTINVFFYIFSLFLPITSILIFPSIQGSIPSTFFVFFSIVLVYTTKQHISLLRGYNKDIFLILFTFLFLSCCSQLINGLISIPSMSALTLVDPLDQNTVVFRSSFFTQSAYLLTGLLTFVFVKRYYNSKWDKPLYIGIGLYACYGLYEFFYYIATGSFGDFLTNRNYGDHDTIALGNQLMTIGSLTIQRINGLALEPSMFAFTVMPFWIYSLFTGKKKISLLLFIVLCLSTSTTALLGIVFYFIAEIKKINKLWLFFSLCFIALIIMFNYEVVYQLIDKMFLQKLNQSTESGIARSFHFENHLNYFLSLNFLSMIFGLGFGYVRSTDFFTTLLINNGIIGLLIFTSLFLYPIIKLKSTRRNTGLKILLVIIFITMMISVPEFSFLSIWLFLGIAYNQLYKQKAEALE